MLIFVFFCIRIVNCGELNGVPKLSYDFYQLSFKAHFVDKSELLYTFFDERTDWLRCGSQFFYYVTCPRGFGKSTNLRMIQNFAQIEMDKRGNRVPKQNTTAYRLFKDLKIAKIPQFLEKHLAEYPVIYLDLNFAEEELINETVAIGALFKKIQKCYEEYAWLKPAVRNLTLQYAMHNVLHGTYDINLLRRSIHDLANILYGYFEKEVVLLIDDFDCAARLAMETLRLDVKILYFILHEILDKAHHFTSFAKHCFITGVTTVNFRSEAYKHAIVEHCPFLDDHRFGLHFGFDDDEVEQLAGRYNCSKRERDNLKGYYRGYKVLHLNRRIYNPLSISRYFISKAINVSENELLKRYWAASEKTWFVSQFVKAHVFQRKIAMLMQNGTLKLGSPVKEYPPKMFFRFIQLRDARYDNSVLKREDVNGFFVYFFETGFLSHSEEHEIIFQLPNVEIKEEFESKFQNLFISLSKPVALEAEGHKRYRRAVTESMETLEYSAGDFLSNDESDDDEDYDDDGGSESKEEITTKRITSEKTTPSNFTTKALNKRNRHLYTYVGPGHREAKQVTLRTLTKFGSTTSTRSRASLRALNWYQAMLTTKFGFFSTTLGFPYDPLVNKLWRRGPRRSR